MDEQLFDLIQQGFDIDNEIEAENNHNGEGQSSES